MNPRIPYPQWPAPPLIWRAVGRAVSEACRDPGHAVPLSPPSALPISRALQQHIVRETSAQDALGLRLPAAAIPANPSPAVPNDGHSFSMPRPIFLDLVMEGACQRHRRRRRVAEFPFLPVPDIGAVERCFCRRVAAAPSTRRVIRCTLRRFADPETLPRRRPGQPAAAAVRPAPSTQRLSRLSSALGHRRGGRAMRVCLTPCGSYWASAVLAARLALLVCRGRFCVGVSLASTDCTIGSTAGLAAGGAGHAAAALLGCMSSASAATCQRPGPNGYGLCRG